MLSRDGSRDKITSPSRESMSPRAAYMLSRGAGGATISTAARESMADPL